jgi:hypothetical protein
VIQKLCKRAKVQPSLEVIFFQEKQKKKAEGLYYRLGFPHEKKKKKVIL